MKGEVGLSTRTFDAIFRPYLVHVFEHHVAVAVEGLDSCQQLVVVAQIDEDLGVGLDAVHEDGQRTCAQL